MGPAHVSRTSDDGWRAPLEAKPAGDLRRSGASCATQLLAMSRILADCKTSFESTKTKSQLFAEHEKKDLGEIYANEVYS